MKKKIIHGSPIDVQGFRLELNNLSKKGCLNLKHSETHITPEFQKMFEIIGKSNKKALKILAKG